MNRLSELATSFQDKVEEYIRALDEAHADLKADAEKFLKSLQNQAQTGHLQLTSPVEQERSSDKAFFGGKTANIDVIRMAIKKLRTPELTVHDVRRWLRAKGTELTDDQIGTAFRKLVAREGSPLQKIREGRGHIPPMYRVRSVFAGSETNGSES
jgi:hypothetical protein